MSPTRTTGTDPRPHRISAFIRVTALLAALLFVVPAFLFSATAGVTLLAVAAAAVAADAMATALLRRLPAAPSGTAVTLVRVPVARPPLRRLALVLAVVLLLPLLSAAGAGSSTVHAAGPGAPGSSLLGTLFAGPDQAAAPDALDLTGGPDAWGYTFRDNLADPAVGYNFVDIEDSGEPLCLADDVFEEVDLELRGSGRPPFDFHYYNQTHDDVRVSSNGFLNFGGPGGESFRNQCPIPDPDAPNNSLYGLWDDLFPFDCEEGIGIGQVLVETRGEAPYRVFIAQWNNVGFYDEIVGGCGPEFSFGAGSQDCQTVKFQIKIYETTNIIRYDYADVESGPLAGGASATVGIESPSDLGEDSEPDPTGLLYNCGTESFLGLMDAQTALATKGALAEKVAAKPAAKAEADGDAPSAPEAPVPPFLRNGLAIQFDPPNSDLEIVVDCYMPDNAPLLPLGAGTTPQVSGNALTRGLAGVAGLFGAYKPNAPTDISPDILVAGANAVCRFSVINHGPSAAQDPRVRIKLPPEVEFINDTDNCEKTPGGEPNEFSCNLPFIPGPPPNAPPPPPVGGTPGCPTCIYTFEFDFYVPPDYVACTEDGLASFPVTARVFHSDSDPSPSADIINGDPRPDNNRDEDTDTVKDRADLTVMKMSKPDTQVRAGQPFTYTVIVENLGPSHARGVQFDDTILSDGSFRLLDVIDDPDRPFDACTPNPPPTVVGGSSPTVVHCELNEALEPVGAPLENGKDDPTIGCPPCTGRWVVQMVVTADRNRDINNTVRVFTGPDDDDLNDDCVDEWENGTVDFDESNNKAVDFISVLSVADLSIRKVDNPDPVIAGTTLAYTLTVRNDGPSPAENVVVMDNIPIELIVDRVNVQGSNTGTCSLTQGVIGNPKVTCNLDTLNPGDSRTISIRTQVKPDTPDGTILHNQACVSSDTFDADNSDNCANERTLVIARANLSIEKDADPDPVVAGEQLEYEMVVTNNGPSFAQDVVVKDVVDPDLTVLDAFVVNKPGAFCNIETTPNQTVECFIGDMAPGEKVTVRITTLVDPNTDCDKLIENTATATTPTPRVGQTGPQAVFADSAVNVDCRARVTIEKTAANLTPVAGTNLTYSIKVTNHGPSVARRVVVTDTLPALVTPLLVTLPGCTVGNLFTPGTGCSLGNLQPGQMVTFQIVVRIEANFACDTVLINRAAVSWDNNIDGVVVRRAVGTTAVVRVLCESDLRVRKFGKPDAAVRAGEILTYTVIVDNLGPSFADAVALKDVLQSSGVFSVLGVTSDRPASCASQPVSVNGNPFTIPPEKGATANINQRYQLDCTLTGRLEVITAVGGPPNQGRWIVTMRVTANQTQDINNVASVVTDPPDRDPDPSNNEAFVEHDITDVADLQVTKADFPDPVIAGQALRYTIRITNTGPSDAENVLLIDRLPPGIVVLGVVTSNGSTCATGQAGEPLDRLTCGLGLLVPGASATVTVNAIVNPDVPEFSKLENDVFVTSDIFDPDDSDNYDHEITMVMTEADLRLTKAALGMPIAGTSITYRFEIRNLGPSVSRNVSLTDTLPAALVFQDAYVDYQNKLGGVPLPCGLQVGNNVINCPLGDIPVMQPNDPPIIVTVNVFIKANTPNGTVLMNNAALVSDTPDPTPATAFTKVTVKAVADLFIQKMSMPVKVYAGEQKKYTIWIQNFGPSDAQEVVVVDTLPNEVIYEIDTALCSNAGQVVTCNFGTLPVGESRHFDIYVLVKPDTPPGTIIKNTAVVSQNVAKSMDPDPDPHPNTAMSENLVLQKADLNIRKYGKMDGQVRAGEILTYTVIVDNLGPSFANAVTVKDILSSSGVFNVLGVTSDRPASCSSVPAPGGGNPFAVPPEAGVVNGVSQEYQLDCTLTNPLAVLSPVGGPPNPGRWILTVRITAPQTQDVNNTAVAQSDIAFDPDTSNNLAYVEHEITDVADLKVAKGAVGENTTPGCPAGTALQADRVTAGQRLTYTVTVINDGPSDAENVVVSDRLPPGVTVLGVPTLVSPPEGIVNCTTGTPASPKDKLVCGVSIFHQGDPNPQPRLRPGETVVFQYTVLVASNVRAGTILENDVSVSSDIFDDDLSNNFASNLTTVNAWADLTVTKVDRPDPVVAGQNLEYEIKVTNKGPSDAKNVIAVDTLPNVAGVLQVTFLRADGAACRQDPILTTQVTCFLGDIPAGEGRTYFIVVRVNPDAIPTGLMMTNITNSVTVFSDANGNGMNDPLPAVNGDNIIDPDLVSPACANTAIAVTTVNRVEDVFIMKSDDPDPVLAGKELTYTIMFGNNGPSTATQVKVTDTLPLGVFAIPFPALPAVRCEPLDPNDEVACTLLSGDGNMTRQQIQLVSIKRKGAIVWNSTFNTTLNDLDPGETYGFRLVVRVESGYVLNGRGEIFTPTATQPASCRNYFLATGYPHFAHNQARIMSSKDLAAPGLTNTDPVIGNNVDDECTRVNSEADLVIDKVDDFDGFLRCDPVQPGGMITYDLIVTNRGPSDAAVVKVVDWLPDIGVALDPAQVQVEVINGQGFVVEVRDDGRITVIVGRDPDNKGHEMLGRLNAGNSVRIRIRVMVGIMAPCGALLKNTATVSTMDGFVARLNGASEVPPVATTSLGLASFFFDAENSRLFFLVDVSDIVNITLAHIHQAPVGVNGPIIFNLFLGPTGAFNPAAPISGNLTLNASQLATLLAGGFYVNVHTTAFPAGQIRGQIGPLAATKDPDLSNNMDMELTKVECPRIKVEKTVSFDGTCPGLPGPTTARPGLPITWCIKVTNTGTTFLDKIIITDTLRSAMAPMVVTRTLVPKDPKFPLMPGEMITTTIQAPKLQDMCGTIVNEVEVSAIPTNSGKTVFPCLSPVRDRDAVQLFVPCGGADFRLQLPIVNSLECETWIQIQNVGKQATKAIVVYWGEAGACPPQSAGPLKMECTGLLKPGSAWTMYGTSQIPPGANSAIVYAVNAVDRVSDERGNILPFADLVCDVLFNLIVGDHGEWLRFDLAYQNEGIYYGPIGPAGEQLVIDFGAHKAEPLAVSVNRTCPDPVDPNRDVSAAYTGVSTDAEGVMDPRFGAFMYYAPLIFANKGGLNSWLYIQNSGTECTSLEIWFKGQDNCLRPILGDVLALSPGETVHFDPNTVVGPDWLGNAWIRSSQPLGIVVDTMGPNHFTSYRGVPADSFDADFSLGSQVNFAPLVYSEFQGWDSAIQVQNLSAVVPAKVKVYFLDRSGDIVTTLVDWICPRGSQTFFLPLIDSIPGNWVGSARVESQEWWTPGGPVVDPPRILSVVLLEKWSDPARTERREAIAYNALTECTAYKWQLGKDPGGVASGSAVIAVPILAKSNNRITSELAITNLVPKPGFTDFVIFIFDQNGFIDQVCEKLNEKQVEYIDLATWGYVPPRFLGSAVISATFWEHDVFDGSGQFRRNLVGLGAVVIERVDGILGGPDVPGDEAKGFEAIPIFNLFNPPDALLCPGVPPGARP